MGVIGNIHSIETFGTLDGPGIRYVAFLQGCALRCLYCHNPDTWACRGGTPTDAEDLLADILTYRSFIKTGGVTLSGGEPLLQMEFALDILERCAAHGIHTALDTAGTLPLNQSIKALNAASLILLDIKALDDELCQSLTGHGNSHSLRTLEYCESIKKPLWIRHVLLPGYTMAHDKLAALADYLSGFTCVERVELLPFHKMGEHKWKSLHVPYALWDTQPPEREALIEAKALFKERNLPVLLRV